MIKTNLPTGSPSNIRMQGTRDMLQVKDPYKNQWIDWQQTGVIVLPSTITITTTTLEGQAVICQIGEYSQTTTFVNGVAYFDMIFETGTATITCGEWTTTVEVTELGQSYSGELEEITELVLWDGSSAQNGAYLNGALTYKCEAGSMTNATINYTFKATLTGTVFLLWCNNTSVTVFCDAYKNVSTAKMDATQFLSGQTYSFPLKKYSGANTITDFLLLLRANSGDNLYVHNYCSKIWIE